MTSRPRRQQRRRLGLESLENRMVLSGLGLASKGIELPIDDTPAAEKVCVAKNPGNAQSDQGAEASETVVKPWKIKGGGTADFLPIGAAAGFNSTGTATHLGKYSGLGTFQVIGEGPEFSSVEPFVFTAANGDELHATFHGVVELTPTEDGKFNSTWTATFEPVVGKSTGNFAHVVGGSLTMVAKAGPFNLDDVDIPYTWKGEGELEFAKSVPYTASGTGDYSPLTGDYSGTGVGNVVGVHEYFGNVTTDATENPLVFSFQNTEPQTIIADNGDELYVTLSGQVTLMPQGVDEDGNVIFTAVWSGDAVVEGGTGRFADAKPGDEPMKVTAVNDPFTFVDPTWSFSWTLEGEIVLR